MIIFDVKPELFLVKLKAQAISLQGPWGQVPPLTRKQSCLEGSRNKRYLILNQKECPLSIEALFNPSINYPQDPKNGLQVTPPQIGLTTIISRRKQKQLGPPQKIAGDRPCLSLNILISFFTIILFKIVQFEQTECLQLDYYITHSSAARIS